ncbi:MAG: RNA repair domain-containing protein [Candidatus Nanoarchaeia archaeon]
MLDKIKWDKRHKPENVMIGYEDRVEHKMIMIPYMRIKRIEGSFMILTNEKMREVNVPLHRIREILENDEAIWERKHEGL